MVFGLSRLFGGKPKPDSPPCAAAAAGPSDSAAFATTASPGEAAKANSSAFVRREAVFDRERRPAGHVFRLQHADAGLADAPTGRQAILDDALLQSLGAAAHEEDWGKSLAFVPLSTASLDHPGLDRLPSRNTVLLLALAPETGEADALSARLAARQKQGFRFGIFRQPKHPAFAAALSFAHFGAIDVAGSQGGQIRDFSLALRSHETKHAVDLVAVNIETKDDHHLCQLCHFGFFHGPFVTAGELPEPTRSDPHKLHLLHLFNLVQSDTDTAEIATILKQDPMLTFRILRYLNSPAIGLSRPVASIDQALFILGRQRLARWLSVLLFSVKNPDFADWLLVESSLGRGRVMELLGARRFPAAESDHLFLTGVFSRLDRLLRMPLAEALAQVPLPIHVRNALLDKSGPYVSLLAVAEACEAFDSARIETTARAAGFEPDDVNRALLAATAWTSEITAQWE